MNKEQTKIKVEDYGDMFAKVKDMRLVKFEYFGSYQGQYLVVLEDDGWLYFYIGSYGSCSGCDWLEAERDFEGEVNYKEALEYCNSPLTAKVPVVVWNELSDRQKRLFISDDVYSERDEMGDEIIKVKP